MSLLSSFILVLLIVPTLAFAQKETVNANIKIHSTIIYNEFTGMCELDGGGIVMTCQDYFVIIVNNKIMTYLEYKEQLSQGETK